MSSFAEVGTLGDGDEAARWTLRALPAKNRLTDTHARRIEEAFEAKLASFAGAAAANEPAPEMAEAREKNYRFRQETRPLGNGQPRRSLCD